MPVVVRERAVTMMTNDVEKRWHDPQMFRAAVTYVVCVVALAGLALASYAFIGDHSVLSAILVPTVLFVGGVGGFVRTYQVWKAGGTWPIWHGAGWFLLALSLVSLAVPGSAMLSS
jgi:hypothetical protein